MILVMNGVPTVFTGAHCLCFIAPIVEADFVMKTIRIIHANDTTVESNPFPYLQVIFVIDMIENWGVSGEFAQANPSLPIIGYYFL